MNFKLLIISFFICITQITFSQEIKFFYYPDSTISAQGVMRNGKPDGYWKNYYANGKLKSEGKRTNFELDSIWNFYFENGKLHETITYNSGSKEGLYVEYIIDSIGRYFLYSKGNYEKNKKQGTFDYYLFSNLLTKQIPYINDNQEGIGFEFKDNEEISAIVEYKNNKEISKKYINLFDSDGNKHGVWIDFFPNKSIQTEANYIHGKLNGSYIIYNPKKEIIHQGFYTNDTLVNTNNFNFSIEKKSSNNTIQEGLFSKNKPIGLHKFYSNKNELLYVIDYDSIGNKISKGKIINNLKEGLWEFYSANIKIAEGNYEKNKKQGLWKYYYLSTVIMQEGFYIEDEPTSTWKYFFEDGTLCKFEEYEIGKRNGSYIEFDEAGNKTIEGEFKQDKKHGFWNITKDSIISHEYYNSGDKIKIWKTWYKDGNLKSKCTYSNNKAHKKHIYYYNSGQIKKIEQYLYGIPIKNWSFYDEKGKLLFVEYYENGMIQKIAIPK